MSRKNPEPKKKDKTTEILRAAADEINAALKDSVVTLGIDPLDSEVKIWIPTGWTLLDQVIGGGLPVGRTVELYGKESAGKTTLAVHAMVGCQRLGGVAVLFDPESTFDRDLATRMGVNFNRLLIMSPKIALEDVFTCFLSMIEVVHKSSPEVPILMVWDTLAATPTKKEQAEQNDSGRMGGQYRAQVVRRGMRSITHMISKTNTCLLVLNHVYDTAVNGIMLTETPGGRGVKFHASIRIHLKSRGWIREKEDGDPVGAFVLARVEKNKLACPRREVVSRLYFGKGFSDLHSLFDAATDLGVVRKAGAWSVFTVGDRELKFYGSALARIASENPDFEPALRAAVMGAWV